MGKEKNKLTRRYIIAVAIVAVILLIAGAIMIFSNNGKIENGEITKNGQSVSALEEGQQKLASQSENNERGGVNPSQYGTNPQNLNYYNNTVVEESVTENGKKTFRITNKYKGPVISAEKEVKTTTELGYVVEGEEIEYTIIAKNAGDVAKDVVIKDPIVAGIEFVEGSIKVNGESNYTLNGEVVDLTTKTATDLTNGITVNVPAKTAATEETAEKLGETKLTFKARVKALEGQDLANLQKEIINTAIVDDVEARETIIVKKADVKPGKTATVKKATPAKAGEEIKNTVEKGDEITYTISATNDGKAKATVRMQDSIPTGTTYIENSIKIWTENKAGEKLEKTETITLDELKVGKDVEVDAGEVKKVSFTVTVNDIENDTVIKNEATVNDDKPKVEYTYIEPIIAVEKTVTKEDGTPIENPNYVLEGQVIKYKITATNTGSKQTDILVQDTIPEGLTFVEGSIIVNSEERADLGKSNLENGITVNVPAKTETTAEDGSKTVTPGETVIEFKATVNELAEGLLTRTITNTATVTVDNSTYTEPLTDDVPVTVNKPDLHASKAVSPAEGTKVKTGDEITYTILLDNSKGTAPTTAIVKDTAPKGTTIKQSSNEGEGLVKIVKDETIESTRTEEQLKVGTEVELAAGETKTVVFTVVVGNKAEATEEEKIHDGDKIRNIANVNEENTNTTENHYIEPIITSKKEVTTEKNLGYVVKGEKVTYTITVENAGGLEKEVLIKDTISEKLTLVENSTVVTVNDEENTEITKDLANGIRVTVPAKVGETNGRVVVTFDTTVNTDAKGELVNVATIDDKSTSAPELPIVTFEKKSEINRTTTSDQTIATGKVTAKDEIVYTVKVTNSGNETANSIEVKDKVPEGTTLKENSITENGQVVDNKDITWTITNLEAGQSKEVSFTAVVNYSEKDRTIENTAYVAETATGKITTDYIKPTGTIENNITKTATTKSGTNELGTSKITAENEEIIYDINYTAKVKDYVGDAVVTVTDILPYAIDEEKSDLTALGEKGVNYNYDAETHTITFTNTINGIDTYTNGAKEINIAKQIKVVYVNMDYSKTTFTNTTKGKVTLKYLEDEEAVDFAEVTATIDTVTDFRTEVEIIKQWNHTNNIYGNPESVTIQLIADGVVLKEQVLTMADKVENDENTWAYTFTGLQKYAEDGHQIDYTVSEKE